MTNKQKDALATYLSVYRTQKQKDPGFDNCDFYTPMYFKALDGMHKAGFTQPEIDHVIIYREEILAKLLPA